MEYSKLVMDEARRCGCKYVATNAEGSIFGYADVPRRELRGWYLTGGDYRTVLIRLDGFRSCPDWKDSLVRVTYGEAPRSMCIDEIHTLLQKAPSWAQWAAVDADGAMWLYEDRPEKSSNGKYWINEFGTMGEMVDNVGPQSIDLYLLSHLGAVVSLQPADSSPPAKPTLSPYVDLMSRLVAAVDAGKLPEDTFRILWGNDK